MDSYIPWPWAESLASLGGIEAEPLRVRRIVFGLVRDRCREVGLDEGSEVRFRGRTRDAVTVELPDGTLREIEVAYAWFIQVEPVDSGRVVHAA